MGPAESPGKAGREIPREPLSPSRPLTYIAHLMHAQQICTLPISPPQVNQTPCFEGLFFRV